MATGDAAVDGVLNELRSEENKLRAAQTRLERMHHILLRYNKVSTAKDLSGVIVALDGAADALNSLIEYGELAND